MQTIFDTPPDEAYLAQEVLPAGQRWFAFDVPMAKARTGQASRFVMTLWDNKILRDSVSGTFWYKVPRHEPDGDKKLNRTSLCTALHIAQAQKMLLTGMLKGHIGKKWCSLKHLFTIVKVLESDADDALWLCVVPHDVTDIGCKATVLVISAARTVDDQLAEINLLFAAQVYAARGDREARLQRLSKAPKLPRRIVVTSSTFVRNPDVVAEVLDQANGRCGYCGDEAPFSRKVTGEPYLEVHHKIHLAQGGEDIVENAIAACPNCHREKHYG